MGMADSQLRVAIIGAGIGGLSLGLALQERGIQADVFEQAPELTEIGAAIALSANSIREYTRLGLTRRAGRQLHGPHRADLPALAGRLPYRRNPVQEDGWYEKRFGAPYFGIHRADLQKTLSAAFNPGHLHLGCRLVNLVQEPDAVRPGVRQRPRRAGRHRRRGRRRAVHRAALGHRRRRRRLLRDQRLPRHRADREPALAARPARHPVLDGPRRAPAALRHRRPRRIGELLRRRRDPEASGYTPAPSPRCTRSCRSPPSEAGTRPSPR